MAQLDSAMSPSSSRRSLSHAAIATIAIVILIGTILGITAYQFTAATLPEHIRQLNPAINAYYRQVPVYALDQGFAWKTWSSGSKWLGAGPGDPGPHVSLLTYQGQLVGVQQFTPAWRGWYPWMDQTRDSPIRLPTGLSYTQSIYFTDKPSLLHYIFGLPVPQPSMTLEEVERKNPKVAQYYERVSPPYPNQGENYGAVLGQKSGPSLMLTVWQGKITGARMLFVTNNGVPWFPWFDQMRGETLPIPGVGDVYSQHVVLQPGPTMAEIASTLPPLPDKPPEAPFRPGFKQLFIQITEWGFDQRTGAPELRVQRGDVLRIIVTNTGEDYHTFTIDELGVSTPVLNPGESETLEFTVVQPGVYLYFDAFPGHRELGMVGKFIVE